MVRSAPLPAGAWREAKARAQGDEEGVGETVGEAVCHCPIFAPWPVKPPRGTGKSHGSGKVQGWPFRHDTTMCSYWRVGYRKGG